MIFRHYLRHKEVKLNKNTDKWPTEGSVKKGGLKPAPTILKPNIKPAGQKGKKAKKNA